MPFQKAKIYHDGSHYIAIPAENFPRNYKRRKTAFKPPDEPIRINVCNDSNPPTTLKQRFEDTYKESLSLPRKERRIHIQNAMKQDFATDEELSAFVKDNARRKQTNLIARRIRLMRKVLWQKWDYFCTFTYDDKKLTEEQFRKKLSNTLKHMVARKGWKYVGVWERGEATERLHFHALCYAPQMPGELEIRRDLDTRTNQMQTTCQSTHFLKQFGRNDFKQIVTSKDISGAVGYITKYLEKSGERIVYGGKLPTYKLSDVMDDDIITMYGTGDLKAILFDDINCIVDGEILGPATEENLSKLPCCN